MSFGDDQDRDAIPKLLIVDDSRMVRATIIKHIRGRFEFREEADGEAAWQTLVVDPDIELLVTDIGMPQLDGYGLLERVRASRLARLQHMPVLVISGDEDDAAREKARKLGANDFISKGIGSAELLARLDSLSRLARTRRELEESRAALASQRPVDPATGLPTPAYLNMKGSQELALARRHQVGLSVMVVAIDAFDELATRHGANLQQLIGRKLASILSSKVRQEDTVAEIAPGRYVVTSPQSDMLACSTFALRLQKAIEKLVMTYRDDRIGITVSIGVASSTVDGVESVDRLIAVATARKQDAARAGGNRVVSDGGEIGEAQLAATFKPPPSIDQMLAALRSGAGADVPARLPAVVAALLPLLELIETRLNLGLPLDALRRHADGDGGQANG